jgi:hypothetical protein
MKGKIRGRRDDDGSNHGDDGNDASGKGEDDY